MNIIAGKVYRSAPPSLARSACKIAGLELSIVAFRTANRDLPPLSGAVTAEIPLLSLASSFSIRRDGDGVRQ